MIDAIELVKEEPKRKYPRADAIAVARELVGVLSPVCERIVVAGSLRRRKSQVGDVEILFIPRRELRPDPQSLFGETVPTDVAALGIETLRVGNVLAPRLSKVGREAWGEMNKLALHVASGIPVDLFKASQANWWNYLVCRTGGAQSNVAIASAAQERGWKWNPYGSGFSRGGPLTGREFEEAPMNSEEEVFGFVRMPYLQPEERT